MTTGLRGRLMGGAVKTAVKTLRGVRDGKLIDGDMGRTINAGRRLMAYGGEPALRQHKGRDQNQDAPAQ